jgi:hypothetical protein
MTLRQLDYLRKMARVHRYELGRAITKTQVASALAHLGEVDAVLGEVDAAIAKIETDCPEI